MLYFFIHISSAELLQVLKKMPSGSFCFFQLQGGTSRYYGLVRKGARNEFLTLLPPDARQHLEYVDKEVFQQFFLQNIGDTLACLGNRGLLVHLSDEN